MGRLRSELIKLAHSQPELRRHLVPLLKKAWGDRDWSDYDRSAPKTPWGRAQTAYKIAPGVTWYSTAGHGGLQVSRGAAQKLLSDAARKMGEMWGGSYWYEEDIGWAIPFYEVPEWDVLFARKAGGKVHSKQDMERIIKSYFPKYLKMVEENFKLPEPLRPGDTLEFKTPVRFSGGVSFQPGDNVTVYKVTRGNFIFDSGGGLYRLSDRYYHDGDVVKV